MKWLNLAVLIACALAATAKPPQRYSSSRVSQKQKFTSGDVSQPTCPLRFTLISPDHTACLNPPKRIREGLSESSKYLIVNMHNHYRGNVEKYSGQPPAANMEKMVWDDELAELAQKWASNCIWRHEEVFNRNIPGSYPVGQNLARGFEEWKSVLEAWHSEVEHFEYGHGSTNGEDIGHYTQMVWATSSRIGCGFAVCNGSTPYFACNYGPSGNFANMQYLPYRRGTKGSSCSRKFYDYRHGLCDCGGKVCKNGGKVNLRTCTCQCKSRSWIQKDDCSLTCRRARDLKFCGRGKLTQSKCLTLANMGYEFCPVLCHLCPVDCRAAKDYFICKHAGGSWGERECKKWANMPYDYCPITCHLCPAPGEEKNFWEVSQNDGQVGHAQKQPESDINETVQDEKVSEPESDNEQTPTQPMNKPSPSTATPTTTTKRPVGTKIDDGLEDCKFVDLAKCGQTSEKYWPKHYCKFGIWRRCPAMCGKCAATKCQDYNYKEHKLGEFWVTEFGKFTCTRNGVVNERGA